LRPYYPGGRLNAFAAAPTQIYKGRHLAGIVWGVDYPGI